VLQSCQHSQTHLDERAARLDANLIKMRVEQRQDFAAVREDLASSLQPVLAQMEKMTLTLHQSNQTRQREGGGGRARDIARHVLPDNSSLRISATIASHQCPKGCRCQCHTRASLRTPSWLRGVLGQLHWSCNTSISMKSCDYTGCQKSLGSQHFTYYFPRWLLSRAVVASANLDGLSTAGAKVMVNIPLIVPEEDHIVWSLVIAGNVEQLQQLISRDKNLMYVRNQWGQSIMHVSQTPSGQNLCRENITI